jgi:hypothetical protein
VHVPCDPRPLGLLCAGNPPPLLGLGALGSIMQRQDQQPSGAYELAPGGH